MRNAIFGGIGVLWGLAILLYGFLGGGPSSGGAYGAGQMVGMVFGVLLLGAGLFYLVRGIQELNQGKEEKRPRKRKRRRPEEEED